MKPNKQIFMITDGKPTCIKKCKRKGLCLVFGARMVTNYSANAL